MYQEIAATIAAQRPVAALAFVQSVRAGKISLHAMAAPPATGSRVFFQHEEIGQVVAVSQERVSALLSAPVCPALVPGARVALRPPRAVRAGPHWVGRVVDPDGVPLDGRPIIQLEGELSDATVGAALSRRALGPRFTTGMLAVDTLLPLARGQRLGLFAGSGVGKTTLLADFARTREADIIIFALIGERGRDLRTFATEVLDTDARARSVIIAATSDQPPQVRARCLDTAIRAAEHFRDQGRQVLLLVDSVTRFAEAERELSAATEGARASAALPAGFSSRLARLCERIGPGSGATGDISAVISVLVSGGDMEEPVADLLRGLLDGHIVLSRDISEGGRFPAIDVTRSVSRSLPEAASDEERAVIARARNMIATYDEARLLIRSGLYVAGGDAGLDAAVARHARIEEALARKGAKTVAEGFALLRAAIGG